MISDIRVAHTLKAAQPLRAANNSASAQKASEKSASAAPQDSAQISQNAADSFHVDLDAVLAATAKEAKSLAAKLPEHVEGEVLVKIKPGFGVDALNQFAEDYGSKVIKRFDIPQNMFKSFNGELLHLKLKPGMTTAQAIAAMEKDPRVVYAASNDILHSYGEATPVVPDDLDPRLWGLNNTGQDGGTPDADIDAPEAWSITTGLGAPTENSPGGPVIAVIDTGVDYNHPDLAGNIWTNPNEVADGTDTDGNGVVDDIHGYNAINKSGDPMDDNSHGTHVSGTIGAKGNDGTGVVGVNWNAQIMASKFLDGSGSGTLANAIDAIMYASRNGARITSNSWGGGGYNEALKDALASSPALHIFAAGNERNNDDVNPTYPSAFDLDNIVSVAATDRNDRLASFSNYGATTVDLAAPGVDIYSTVPNGGHASYSGTSMATPHVSGVAALILSKYPDLTNEQVKARLLNGVDKLPQLEGKVLTGGRLNAYNALEDDSIAPAAPNDFRSVGAAPGEVQLSWTATGDDGWCGNASGYVLKMSDRPIVDGDAAEGQISFDSAPSVSVGNPHATGTIENQTVNVPLSGQERTYYFALKVKDNVGNLSEIRTAQVTVPAATVAFEDNIDSDTDNWVPDSGWGKVDVEGRGKVWTDSPDGKYGNDADTSLTTRDIDLNLTGSTLMFDAKIDLENRYDNMYVEVAEVPQDGDGTEELSWNRVASFTGASDWTSHQVDLSAYDGKKVKVRFRLKSDSSVNRDGVYLDNVVIAGDRPAE